MYFYLQTLELLSGKAFNIMSDILHVDVRNVSYITEHGFWGFFELSRDKSNLRNTQ